MPPRQPNPDMLTLLRGVSRSFYLSIRLLPPALRRPVALAYLLARAADSLADTAELAPDERLDKLATWAGAVDGRLPASMAAAISDSFAPLQQNRPERDLIQALPQCLTWLEQLGDADCADVRAVLRPITSGQALDVERFARGGAMHSLDSAEQLHEYTYLVAGCVGEFWTDLCFRHLPAFAMRPQLEMRELGRRYGMALQLVNILRDAGADLAGGRCYFPADELAAAGLGPSDILADAARFEPVWQHWQAQAEAGLALGMEYVDAVASRRVRAASALPALLAARTLALARAAGPERLRRPVKMPRREVRAVMARLAVTLAGRVPLRASFARLRWDNRTT